MAPVTKAAKIKVPRWLIRADMKPDSSEPPRAPREARKKSEPAWLGLRPTSAPMLGINGEKMNRLMKVRKKSRVTKSTLP